MSKTPVVTVNNETLYKAELDDAVLEIYRQKTVRQLHSLISKMWINTKLVYNKAKQNIVNKEEIDQLVEDHRGR